MRVRRAAAFHFSAYFWIPLGWEAPSLSSLLVIKASLRSSWPVAHSFSLTDAAASDPPNRQESRYHSCNHQLSNHGQRMITKRAGNMPVEFP